MADNNFYKTAAWGRRRKYQLQTEPLCRLCADVGKTTAASVADHIVPHRGDYNAFVLNKLQSLCKPCHDRIKQNVDIRGYSNDCDASGWPIDPNHPSNVRARKGF